MRKMMLTAVVCLCGLAAQAVDIGPYPLDADTLHLWRFDVVKDGVIHDLVRTSPIDMAFYNNAALAASKAGYGNAANTYDNVAGNNGPFVGRVGDYNQTILISDLTGPNGEFTFEALVRPDVPAGSLRGHMEILSGETDAGATDRGFQLRIQNTGTTLRFQTLSGSTTAFDAPITYTPGQWYHVAVTYSGTPNVSGNLKLYWTPVGSATSAVQVGGPFTMTADLDANDATKLCIGNELRSFSLADENFDGLVDEVRISRIARQPDQMLLRTAVSWVTNPVPVSGSQAVDFDLSALQWDKATAANVTKHYLYIQQGEPNFASVSPVVVTGLVNPITAPVTLSDGQVYFWRVDASINNSGPNDPNTLIGPIWSFKTLTRVPAFTVHPMDQAVFAGQTAQFSIELVKETGVTYKWYKGTQPLSNGTTAWGSVISGADTKQLSIANAQVQDEGVYFCRATNEAGSADSGSAALQIKRLVSHYPLEVLNGNTSPDVVGGRDMTLMQEGTAGLPTLDTNVPASSVGLYSLRFDNGDHATDPNGRYAQLPAGTADYKDITVTAWVYWRGGANWQRIIDFGNDTSHYMFLTPRNGSECRFVLNNGSGEQIASTAPLPTNQWVHVAVVLDGNTGRIYINGEPKAQNTAMTINPIDFHPAQNYVGRSQFTADAEFDGWIDDLKIYNYAVDVQTIAAEFFNATGIRPCMEPNFDGNQFNLDNTGSSYCRVDLADLAVFVQKWLASGLQ
ncbi:MAG TPA: immunoglobulin domain-containing protein [Anaerohalosphaeraceae bacterium]|mgnify:FL=1|nr:immunoglobulin domain-containing protein [Anaerohalosphaeraceae bacterium]